MIGQNSPSKRDDSTKKEIVTRQSHERLIQADGQNVAEGSLRKVGE
jgi:hypothetical protein